MKSKSFTLKRGQFELELDNMNFSSAGIYLLKGENGSGKTSFLEEVLKKNKFDDLENIANKVSYFSQPIYRYSMVANEYLNYLNVDELCDLFEIDYLHKNILDISGGEITKLKIIRTLARDVSVYVFDEPTNNLDDKSTEIFLNLIEKISEDKTIIISSHDPRLVNKLNYHTEYVFANGTAKMQIVSEPRKKIVEYKESSHGKIRFKTLLISNFNLLISSLLFLLLSILSLILAFISINEIAFPEAFPDNAVELLDVGEPLDYHFKVKLSEDEYEELEHYYYENPDYLSDEELKKLLERDDITNIYIWDNVYMTNLGIPEDDVLEIVAVPNVMTESKRDARSTPASKGFLIKGRLPKDNANECTISLDKMYEDYNYTGDINDIIGLEIEVANKKCQVVGVSMLDVINISFEDGMDQYGIIDLTSDNFDSIQRIKQFKIDNEYWNINIDRVFITYENSSEKEVHDEIFKLTHSYQVTSNLTQNERTQYQFKQTVKGNIPIVTLLSVIGAIIFIVSGTKSAKGIYSYFSDMSDVSLTTNKIKTRLFMLLCFDFVVSIIIILIALTIFITDYQYVLITIPLQLISIIIFFIATLIVLKRITKKYV